MNTRILHITNSVNRPRKKLSNVTGVVVHWTANENNGADAEANRNYFQRTTRPASCHLLVDDRELIEALPWKKNVAEMAYHVGATQYNSTTLRELNTTYPNNCTVGLEICVNADANFSVTYQNAIKVTAMMLKEHGLGVNRLYRHKDVTGKACPGFFVTDIYANKYLATTAALAWKAFVSAVAKVLEGGSTPVSQPTTISRTLRPGSNGADVKLMQEMLIKAGYKLPLYGADGYYGSTSGETYKAVVQFQKDHGLTTDGIFGPTTLKVLQEALKPKGFYRVFRNSVQEGAFTVKEGAIEFANTLHKEDPYDKVTIEDPNNKQILLLQDEKKVIEIYRVRKTANDVDSQKGAFTILENAKRIADENPGYKVFNGKGEVVYEPAPPKVQEPKPKPPKEPEDVNIIQADWTKIMGQSGATIEQMIYYVNQYCPNAPEDIAKDFYEVGLLEGVRGDIALAQAIKETGSFNYGGDVKPEQNNFAGIGATGGGEPGNSFQTVREGVTAQIQHLKAYASIDELKLDCADPRFKYVVPRGKAPHVEQLAGKWAVPGYEPKQYSSLKDAMNANDGYGHQIMKIVERIKAVEIPDLPMEQPKEEPQVEPAPEEKKEEVNVSLLNKVLQLIYDFLTKFSK